MRLPDLDADVPVQVPGEPGGSDGPAADVQQVSGSVRDAADPGRAHSLYETLGPACSHQGHLSTRQQRNPPLRCQRVPNADPDLDQNLSLRR